MKIAFYTLGCKVNQYETEAIKEQFIKRGHTVVEETEKADCYVINTCTVTNLADRKSRQFIRRADRLSPGAVIAVTGCYSQIMPDDLWDMPEVDVVTGTGNKQKLIDMVEAAYAERKRIREVLSYDDLREYTDRGIILSMEGRTRAYIKIQEGCDRFCAYCLIPYARGRARSRDPEEIVEEARVLIDRGFKEIVLTGINTALYGTEPGFASRYSVSEEGIESIIKMISEIPGNFRLRLSSLEPTVVNAGYVERLLKYPKLCPHLHLSIQSGSDRILKAMNRRYTRDEYLDIVRVLKAHDPGYGITTDIIVGFPGETDEDFRDSLDMVNEAGFLKVHVFKYSKRKGTKAEAMKDQVGGEVKNLRSDELQEAGEKAAAEFFEREKGRARVVLFEEITADGLLTGYTENYIKTYVPVPAEEDAEKRLNGFFRVRLDEAFRDGMKASLI
ncbi:MAG: tRNA (N(6)-L-threonylcarbamoyladenosine(37)-C(2))-methylthiotransferase MtaB [Firmicutes bacterium]|nr:tRNA (N(6)-L-threonylcarbamoyladenosine(37)-C(2))-methylthiotransferase MtaB [Bacillota bacterium]